MHYYVKLIKCLLLACIFVINVEAMERRQSQADEKGKILYDVKNQDLENNSSKAPHMSATKIFLIRHGQTDWNLTDKIQGHTDIPLNIMGKMQAQKVAQFLQRKTSSLAALYSSDLQRAHQTAKEISKVFSLEIILTTDLREGNFGKAEGLTKQEFHDLYGPYNHLALPEALEAEPRDQVVARVTSYLHKIVQKHKGQDIAVVTHGGALRSLLTHLEYNVADLPAVTNESITTLIWHENRQAFVLESIEHA